MHSHATARYWATCPTIADLECRPSSVGTRSNHIGGVASKSRLEGSSMCVRFSLLTPFALSSSRFPFLPCLKGLQGKGPTHLSMEGWSDHLSHFPVCFRLDPRSGLAFAKTDVAARCLSQVASSHPPSRAHDIVLLSTVATLLYSNAGRGYCITIISLPLHPWQS